MNHSCVFIFPHLSHEINVILNSFFEWACNEIRVFHLHFENYTNAFNWPLQTFLKARMEGIDFRLNVYL